MNKILNALFLIFFAPFSFAAGPFGLNMGVAIDAIDKNANQAARYVYTTKNVPKPHSAFESYVVKIAPRTGLCWVKGLGVDIQTSTYGLELKYEFSGMYDKLTKLYGKSQKTDLLMPGSIWNEPNEFMKSLIVKERILMAVWEEQYGSELKDNIKTIVLIASPLSRNEGYLALEYSFSNKEDCDKEIAAQEDDAL